MQLLCFQAPRPIFVQRRGQSADSEVGLGAGWRFPSRVRDAWALGQDSCELSAAHGHRTAHADVLNLNECPKSAGVLLEVCLAEKVTLRDFDLGLRFR